LAKTEQSAYRILRGSTRGLPDVENFLLRLQRSRKAHDLFDRENDIFVARAPGRLDVMGGIADYSGSLVLQLPIQQAAVVAVQPNDSQLLQILSLGNNENGRDSAVFTIPLNDIAPNGKPLEYGAAHDYFQGNPEHRWAAYIAGALPVLMHECAANFRGLRILLNSHVPEGKGVSSSAAIEVAVMQAVCAALHIQLAPLVLALFCQTVENLVVGAPCGVMDQMTAACGEQGRLLKLLCQPAHLLGTVTTPDDIAFWGIDSGVRHSVSGSDYTSVRVGAFMGYRIIADLAGLRVHAKAATTHVEITDPRWSGYLANLTPSEFEQFRNQIPKRMIGKNFLDQFHGTTDSVTHVDPQRTYAVRQATAHAVYEHSRVKEFADLLVQQLQEERLERLGELMYQSHASYSACGLGSEGTDLLVQLVRAAGPRNGLFGAKITGGGSGGTVAIVGKKDADRAVQEIASDYAARTGHRSIVFRHSSPGSAAFGILHLSSK